MIERHAAIHCLGCQYSLVGLESRRCPECGRKFDPNDPNSFAELIVNGRGLITRTLIGYSLLLMPLFLNAISRIFDLRLLGDYLGSSFLESPIGTIVAIITMGPLIGWVICASVVEKCVRVYRRRQCTAIHRGAMNWAFALSLAPASIPFVGIAVMIGIVIVQIILAR